MAADRANNETLNHQMKLFTKTVALLGLVLAFAGTASAQTTIRIAGSTAYRPSVVAAIMSVLDSGFTFNATGTNVYSAGAQTFVGQLNQGNPATDPSVVIQCFWTGSLAGVYDLSNQTAFPAGKFISATSAA